MLTVQSTHHEASPRVVPGIHPDIIVGHDAGLTVDTVFEEAHKQGQRFSQVVDRLGPHVDGVIALSLGGTGGEGPNVLDIIGTHQLGGGVVDVGLVGRGQGLVIGQPPIRQIAAKIIQLGVGGKVLVIRARWVLVQLAVMVGSARQGGHDIQTQLLNEVLQHLTDVGVSFVARQLNRVVDYV